MFYKDILLNYKSINNKLIIIANKIKLFIKNINYILNIKIILINLKELINKD